MEPLARLLPDVMRQLGLEPTLDGWKAVRDWADVVGPRVAEHTRAVSFHDGTLHVEVEGSAWMHELKFLERELVERVNRHLGSPRVRDVRFRVPRGGNLR